MLGFRRFDESLLANFEHDEVDLLSSLIQQMIELLASNTGTAKCHSSDPLDLLEWELNSCYEVKQLLDDPILERLFPVAYPNDAQAAYDFHRFTQPAMCNEKIVRGMAVLDDLGHASKDGRCCFQEDNVDAWLTTLTNLRLSLAVRLEIGDADDAEKLASLPENNPRAVVFSVYEWIGWVQESLLAAVDE